MKNIVRSLFRKMFSRKGTTTIEYVVVIAAAVLLATFLIYAVNNDEVKSTIQATLLKALNGETGSAGRVSSAPLKEPGAPSFSASTPHASMAINGETGLSGKAGSTSPKDSGSPSISASALHDAHLQPSNPKKKETGIIDSLRDGWNQFWGEAGDFVSGVIEWGKEHKETIAAGATVALGVGLLLIPGTQEFGLGILFGAGIGGGLSFLTGNDLKTVMKDIAIGGVFGLFTGGIGSLASKGFQLFLESRAGVWLTSRLGPYIQRFLPSAKYLGSGTLFGALFGGGMSYLSGNDPETVIKDATIGAVVGLLSGGIGGIAAKGFQSFLGSRLGAGLASKLSPFLQRFLPHAVGGSAEGIADSSLWDWFKGNKVNWKRAVLTGLFCGSLVLGGGYLAYNAPKIINTINGWPWPPFQPQVAVSTGNGSVPMEAKETTIGDTAFGQWLQKLVGSGGDDVVNSIDSLVTKVKQKRGESIKTRTGIEIRGEYYVTKHGAIIKDGVIKQVNNVPKIQDATGEVDLNYVAKVRKELGILTHAEEAELVEKKILKQKTTVAVLVSDGKQIWGRSSWGEDMENGYKDVRKEWFEGRPDRPSKYEERVKLAKEGVRFKATNPNTLLHAEGDVFWHLYLYRKKNKIIGGTATLYVDRPLCKYCDQSQGVKQLVEEVGLDELTVISPSGTQIIRPDPNFKRKSW